VGFAGGGRVVVGEVVVVPAVVSYQDEWMHVSRDHDHNEWMWMRTKESKC